MSFKLKAVAAAVLAVGAFSTAFAGQLSGAPNAIAAAELVSNTANVIVPAVTYQTSSPFNGPVAGTNTIFVVLTASAGTWRGDAVPATANSIGVPTAITVASAPNIKLIANPSGSLIGGVAGAPPALDGVLVLGPNGSGSVTGGSTLVYSFTIAAQDSYALGSNIFVGAGDTTVAIFNDPILTGLGSALGLGATFDDCVAPGTKEVKLTLRAFSSFGTQIDTIAPFAPTTTVLQSQRAVDIAVGKATDTSVKIDAVGSASKLFIHTPSSTVGAALQVGTINFLDTAQTEVDNLNVNYDAAAALLSAADLTVKVAGQFTGNGTLSIKAVAPVICSGAAILTGPLAATDLTSTTINFGSAAVLIAGTPYDICFTPAPGNAVALAPSDYTAQAMFSVGLAAPFNFGKYASGGVCPAVTQASAFNGSNIIVRNYSPASVNAFGWNQFTRVINSGGTDASLSGQFVNADGTRTPATPVQIMANIPAGGNVTLTNTAIEAALGAVNAGANATSNPRLELISPTSGLRAQNYIKMPTGTQWMEVSGGQEAGTPTTGVANRQ